MKSAFLTLILLGGLGYWGYESLLNPCDEPVSYSIGTVDAKFGLSRAEVASSLLNAEKVWESALAKNFFQYDQNSNFKINFIYDERQRTVDQKQKTEFGLSASEQNFKAVEAEFNSLKNQYEQKVALHQTLVDNFKIESASYEADVQNANRNGGVSPAEFKEFEARRLALNASIQRINQDAEEINSMSQNLNVALTKRNATAEGYNKLVQNYNVKYGAGLEFDQAEYNGKEINVYEFKNSSDLVVALAHELGHSLGMDHVENSNSIMYYTTGDQNLALTPEDLLELKKVCRL